MRALNTRGELPPGGLIEQIMPESGGLRVTGCGFKRSVVDYLDTVLVDDEGMYPFVECPGEPYTDVETNCWAVMTLAHLHASDRIDAVRDRFVKSVESFFNPRLQLYERDEAQNPSAGSPWRIHHEVVLRHGLRAVGASARPYPRGVAMLERFPWAPQNANDVGQWLEMQWAKGPRAGAKQIFQYALLYCWLNGMHSARDFDQHVRDIVAFLEHRRHADTGYIGAGPGVDIGWAMRGHRNLVHNLHWRFGVGESDHARLVASTLSCRRSDGLFHDGSMCANMDAVHLLAEYGLHVTDQRRQIVAVIRDCIDSIMQQLAADPLGFHYELPTPGPTQTQRRITNGTAFVVFTMRYWQAIDDRARRDLDAMLRMVPAA